MTDTSYENLEDDTPEHVSAGELEVIDGTLPAIPEDRFGAMIRDDKANLPDDPEATSKAIVERILAATTLDEILTPAEARHARELLDTPLTVHAVHFNQSDFQEGIGFYAVVDVTDPETGDEFAVTCGGRNVMGQLYSMARENLLPATVKFTQARRPTRQGYFPLWLVKG